MSKVKQRPDNIYFNANTENVTENFIRAEYFVDKNYDILDTPSNYYLSVEQFYASALDIPIFNYFEPFLSVTIDATSTGGVNGQAFLPYIPSAVNPNFFGVTSIEQFVQMFNTALIAAHAASGAPGNAPVIITNEISRTFIFIIDADYLTNGTRLFFNYQLFLKIKTFQTLFFGFNQPLGKDVELSIYATINNFRPTFFSAAYPVYLFQQQTPSFYLLTNVDRIIVTTRIIPINREQITIRDNEGIDITLGILFTIPINDTNNFRDSKIEYEPPYLKLIDLKQADPLRSIDYQVFYQERTGAIFPVELQPGEGIGVLFGFHRKELYNNKYTQLLKQ